VDIAFFGYRDIASGLFVAIGSRHQHNFLFMIYQIDRLSDMAQQFKRSYYAYEPIGDILPSRLI